MLLGFFQRIIKQNLSKYYQSIKLIKNKLKKLFTPRKQFCFHFLLLFFDV
jgi:hypothetical protein